MLTTRIERSNEQGFVAGLGFLAGILIVGAISTVFGRFFLEPSATIMMLNLGIIPLTVMASLRAFCPDVTRLPVQAALRYVAMVLPTILAVSAIVGVGTTNIFGFLLHGGAVFALNVLLSTGLVSLVYGMLQLGQGDASVKQLDSWLARHEQARTRLAYVSVPDQRDAFEDFDRRLQQAMRETQFNFEDVSEDVASGAHVRSAHR